MNTTFYYLCDAEPQSRALASQLESYLNTSINVIDYQLFELHQLQGERLLVMIDAKYLSRLHYINQQLLLLPNSPAVVIINQVGHLPLSELLQWPKLRGTFRADLPVVNLAKSLNSITTGDNWLNRTFLTQMIDHYQEQLSLYRPNHHLGLTRREIDVLQSLRTGASNTQIADDLFLSENTVKSHLYNIFRKLDVKNRLQAMAWANHYLQ
ncbi:LuxR C-terminal-related transcriptional regulator [Vibrio sp. SCSIO 43136]|uniref:LuxR C-terminal-related transcriptional regulator n=1 Tax=Vibrio sp. SCSIO 43136 TaxID=2819101 RepID=UPI002074EDF0|nr:LuxR C-terminal-related transcriptional regulator [Vibrio sp. SCSIO 43136]USD65028.1 helix-turn-helix transcriptional regulator [Vibrio sp. SCSIO 43136]